MRNKFLKFKAKKVFNVVHTWAEDYVNCKENDVGPIHKFLSGSGATGKSHLVKVIYNAISKI